MINQHIVADLRRLPDHHPHAVIDKQPTADPSAGVDVLYDNIANPKVLPRAFRTLRMNGRLVTAGAHGGPEVTLDFQHLYDRRITIYGMPGRRAADEIDRKDERDKTISRRGDLIGYYVASAGMVGVLALTMLQYEYFWIANALYLSFVVATLVSSVVKLVAYHRGF